MSKCLTAYFVFRLIVITALDRECCAIDFLGKSLKSCVPVSQLQNGGNASLPHSGVGKINAFQTHRYHGNRLG